jgi:hypothetical protein
MRSTGNNLLKVRARALTALMPPLRPRLSEWIEKISACPKACRHCPARWFRRYQTRTASTIFVSLDAGWRVGRSASPRNAVCIRLRTKIRAGAARRAQLREIAYLAPLVGDEKTLFLQPSRERLSVAWAKGQRLVHAASWVGYPRQRHHKLGRFGVCGNAADWRLARKARHVRVRRALCREWN